MLKKFAITLLLMLGITSLTKAQNNPVIYICYDRQSQSISSIKALDAITLEQILKIPTGEDTDPNTIAIRPDRRIAFVGNDVRDTTGMFIVDLIGQRVIKKLFLDKNIRDVRIAPNGLVYVSALSLNGKEVIFIHPETFEVVKSIIPPASPGSVVFSPDGTKAYMVSNRLTILDLKTFSVTESIVIPENGTKEDGIAISPDGKFLYIPAAGLIFVVTTTNPQIVSSLPGTADTLAVEVSRDGKTLYTLDFSDQFLTIVDIPSQRRIQSIPLEFNTRSLKLSPDGRLLYIAGAWFNLYVLDTSTNKIIATRPHNEMAFTEDIELMGDFSVGVPPTVRSIAPQPNEIVQQGQPFTIRWQTTSGGFKPAIHKVELINQITNQTRILADNLSGDAQELQWNVPATPMSDLQIRITATDLGARTTSVLSGLFSIRDKPVMGDQQAPMVRFTNPLGGERFTSGDNLVVNWVSSDNVGVTSQDLALSTDGGITFPMTLANGLTGTTQSFNFTIPSSLQTTQGRLRLIVRDAVGNNAQNVTPMDFQIQAPPDRQTPVVTISSPMTGAMIGAGESIVVNWQSTDNVSVVSQALLLSTNGGGSFQTIMSFAGGVGTFTLNGNLNGLDKTINNAQVKVTAMDGAGNQGEQVASFAVRPVITQSIYSRPILTISGLGFTTNGQANIRVLVNGIEVATNKVTLNGNNSITVQGNKKKLKLVNGENNVQVIVNNIVSNTAKFQFMP